MERGSVQRGSIDVNVQDATRNDEEAVTENERKT